MRVAVFTIALLFIGLLAALTGLDFARYGVTAVGLLAVLILVLLMTGIVGALRHPPRQMSNQLVPRQRRSRRATSGAPASGATTGRRHRLRDALIALLLSVLALLAVMVSSASGPRSAARRAGSASSPSTARPPANTYGAVLAPGVERVRVRLKQPLLSGLLFDVRTGGVLWEREPHRALAIASLTKMMSALVVVAHARPSAQVLITSAATHFTGSGVGLLPLGKRVPLGALLYGLLLPSGNDAAIALAQHVAGDQKRFVAMMNARAQGMNLQCTRFASVSGIVDQGNYSCASDLAVIAHAVVDQPVLGPIVASRSAILPFPIKGGKLSLYNNNPLLELRYPGTDGVKTGFTALAGQCLVATARRGRTWLGVVLLHSGDAADQARMLLNAGFAAERNQSPGSGSRAAERNQSPGSGSRAAERDQSPGSGSRAAERNQSPGSGSRAAEASAAGSPASSRASNAAAGPGRANR